MTCENTDDREQLSQMMFETFAVRQLMLVAQGALELFEHEWWSGVTVHLGGDTSYIMPVYEGSPIAHAITSYVDANLRSLSRWRSLPLTTRVNLAGVASQSLVSCCQSIYCARYRGHNHPPCVPVNGMHHLNLNVSLWMQRAADETECPRSTARSSSSSIASRRSPCSWLARARSKPIPRTSRPTHSLVHPSMDHMSSCRRAAPWSRQLNSIVPDDCTECAEFLFKPAALPGFVLDRSLDPEDARY